MNDQPHPPFGAFFVRKATPIGTEWSTVTYVGNDDDPPTEDEIVYCDIIPRLQPPDGFRVEV